MRAGLQADPDVAEVQLQVVRRDRLLLVDRFEILAAAHGAFEHWHIVDGQYDGMRRVDPGDIARTAEEEIADVEFVLAVGGEVVIDEHAAARSQRQAIDVRELVGIRGRAVLAAARLGARAPDGLAADRARGRDVLVQKRGRSPQHRRDIVETVAGYVLRQQRLHVDRQAEHLPDLARVLGPVEPVHTDASRVGAGGGRVIQLTLHPRHEGIDGGLVGLRIARRRHQAAPQLADCFFPGFRVLRDVLRQHRLEGDPARPILGIVAPGAALQETPLLRYVRGVRRLGLQESHQGQRAKTATEFQSPPPTETERVSSAHGTGPGPGPQDRSSLCSSGGPKILAC